MKMSNSLIKQKNTWLFLFSFLTAAAFLAVCSKSSPLYPFNDWVDANCFFTVGKSMMSGIVPYKDLYEHKGPLLYLLFGLASLLSKKSFLGVFVLEVFSLSGFLYFSVKTVQLYTNNHLLSLFSLPVICFSVTTSVAFAHGGSAEELSLVFLSYTIYSAVAAIKEDRLPSRGELFINGLLIGCVFLIKFTMLGFYIGYLAFLVVYLLLRKQIKKLFICVTYLASGALSACVPFIVFLALNGALDDFFYVYIYNNLFLYKQDEGPSGVFISLLCALRDNPVFGFFILFGVFQGILKRNRETVFLLLSFIGLTVFIYIGGRYYLYYSLILSVFSVFGLAALLNMIESRIKEPPKRTVQISLSIILSVVLLAASYFVSSNTYLMKYKSKDMPQYKFAEIINSLDNPTLLNYGVLDLGVYTASGVVPNCRYFCAPNIPLEEIDETQRSYIANGAGDFIVTIIPLEDYGIESDIYRLAATEQMPFEGNIITYYLYQKS